MDIFLNDPYVMASDAETDDNGDYLWYDFGNYTSSPDFHINEDGIGYMGQVSYTLNSDFEAPYSHTFFFKKTEDFRRNLDFRWWTF